MVGVGEVELMPGHAGALFQTTLEPAEKWDERRQLAQTLEQRTSTEMDFDDDEIGALTLGDELLDAADRPAVGIAESFAEELLDACFAEGVADGSA